MPEIRITEEQEQKHLSAEKVKRNQELSDLRILLNTEQGLRFFKRFFDEGRMFSSCMSGNSWTFYNCGQRDIVAQYFSDCAQACPEKIPELILRIPEQRLRPAEGIQEE